MIDRQLKEQLAALTKKRQPVLEELYKHIHANPELSEREEKTSARVAEELSKLGYEVHSGIGGHGVVGIMDNGPGPCVLLRADMDALPLIEETGLPYASKVRTKDAAGREVGVMHACGHDMHTTCLIGAAALLAEMKDHWRGRVLALGQPAEETVGGAGLMMKDGLYEKVGRPDCCLAQHVDPQIPAGTVALGSGVQSSCSFSVDMTVKGIGGHGASPHQTKDPVVLASRIVLACQSIVSREVKPNEMAVVTVGAIHGGTKRNIIPEEVVLNFSIRAYDDELGRKLVDAVQRTANGQAMAMGLPEELWPTIDIPEATYPVLFNDPQLTARVEDVFKQVLAADKVAYKEPSTGSEDFGFLGKTEPPIPVLMYSLGVRDESRPDLDPERGVKAAPVHDPRFYPELGVSLPTGVISLTAAALSQLGDGKEKA